MAGPSLEPVFIELARQSVHLDPAAFDHAIRSHGVRMQHFRAMPCPVGRLDPDDGRRPHPDHAGCMNGMLYTPAGMVTCLLTGNSVTRRDASIGVLDASIAQITLPRWYDGADPTVPDSAALVHPGDRFYLADETILVLRPDTVLCRTDGRERFTFPAVRVQDAVDDAGIRYSQGLDFDLEEGRLCWRPGRGPAAAGQGAVLSVRYLYRPFFLVAEVPHELRVGQESTVDGPRTIRLPQACVVRREFVLAGQAQNDPMSRNPADPAQERPGPSGSF